MSEPTVEERASAMGWLPKEKFRGDPAVWADADTYVKRGEEVLPILKANNRKLTEQVNSQGSQIAELRTALETSTAAVEELKNFNSKAALDRVKEQKRGLLTDLAAAKKAGDVESEVALTDQLSEVNAAIKDANEEPPAREAAARINGNGRETNWTDQPEWKQWVQENPWFGQDNRRTNYAMAVAADLKRQNPGLGGRALLDKVSEEVEATFEPNRRAGTAKVEGGNGEGGRSESGGKTYADLPVDAREACVHQAKRLVGPEKGKAFKTMADWQKHYVKTYFGEE